eukprot:COSAG03_NODE_969_length_5160_cov_31.898241_1_plen_60_part_00
MRGTGVVARTQQLAATRVGWTCRPHETMEGGRQALAPRLGVCVVHPGVGECVGSRRRTD